MQTNLLEYLEYTAPRFADKIAYSDGTDDMTFSELYRVSRAIGSALCKRGYRKEPIAVLMAKHPRQVASFYGVIYAGCFYVSLDAEMPAERMELILQTVGARLLLTDGTCKKAMEHLHFEGEVLSYDAVAAEEEEPILLNAVRERQIDTDPIYIVFTSGSTGVPKGVAACHRSVIDYTEALSDALGFSENTVFANQTPLYFDAPLKELIPVIKFGATAYLVPRSYFLFPIKLCDYLNRHRVNTICWVVSALTMLSSLGALEDDPPRYLKTIAFGSEVFPKKQYAIWRKAFPNADFYNLYGPTEATGMSCFWHADRELAEDEPIPIGRPFRNTDLLLIGEDGNAAGPGEKGEIYLRGTCVTLGYFNNAEKTNEAFVQNPLQKAYPETVYRTGDIAYRNERGELVFVCRKDAQIKHMGNRIELGEIETVAMKLTDISRALCLYDLENKRILLFYTGSCEETVLQKFLKERLPRYMLPAVCRRTERFPLTPNGKTDRRALLASVSRSEPC